MASLHIERFLFLEFLELFLNNSDRLCSQTNFFRIITQIDYAYGKIILELFFENG
jgi:hypothetical protein